MSAPQSRPRPGLDAAADRSVVDLGELLATPGRRWARGRASATVAGAAPVEVPV